MLAFTLSAPQTFIRGEVPEPKALKGEAVIQIKRSGICGSDVHAYYGKHPYISLPVIPGHEFSGIITEVGEGVTNVKPGDPCTVMPQLYCKTCFNCLSGRYNICENLKVIGCQAPGASQEYLAVDAGLILLLGDMSFDRGAMLEPVSVGIHACRRVPVKGKKVVVQGAGAIGNLTAQTAKALGAEAVIITDINAARLALAATCGADYTVDVSKKDLGTEITRHFGKDGADIIIECVGLADTIGQTIQTARKGSDIVVAGVFAEKAMVDFGLVQDKELVIAGTLMYTKDDWLEAMRFVNEGKIKLEPLISKYFPLTELAEAYKYIERNPDAMKVMITSGT
jgi:L-iditol 2-dehydrogenase